MPSETEFFDISDISLLDLDKIVSRLPGSPWWQRIMGANQGRYVAAFLQSADILKSHNINTALRLGHFLGQGLVETGFLKATSENLNYSASGLRSVFGKYFKTDADAAAYARKPEKIANRVYANRMGNGDEASGEGWKYRGRGFIQLTGKNNYTKFAELTGLPIDTDPDLISRDLKASIQVAAKFFEVNGINELADQNDAKSVSRAINFGNPNVSKPAHGEADRIYWTTQALDLFQTDEVTLLDPREGGVLKSGDKGALVEEFQNLLNGLGYTLGRADGQYGPATRRAVVAFQEEAGLPINGQIDKVTADAIDGAADGVPAATNRATATAADLTSLGDPTPDDSNQIGVAGAVVGAAAVIGGASEMLSTEERDERTAPITPAEPLTEETPGTSTATGTVQPVPEPERIDIALNPILIGALLVVIIGVLFIFMRAGKIKKDRVQDFRSGKIV